MGVKAWSSGCLCPVCGCVFPLGCPLGWVGCECHGCGMFYVVFLGCLCPGCGRGLVCFSFARGVGLVVSLGVLLVGLLVGSSLMKGGPLC